MQNAKDGSVCDNCSIHKGERDLNTRITRATQTRTPRMFIVATRILRIL